MAEFRVALSHEALKYLTFQNYGGQSSIDGVFYHPLKKHRAMEGYFLEYLRIKEGITEQLPIPFDVQQISLSKAEPGRVNAFHIHPKVTQDELWCVIDGTLSVWLVDCRVGSPTCGVRRKYVLNGEEPALLFIPSGVAHGYKSGPRGGLLLYAMNSQFDISDPNEGRLPWDLFGTEMWDEDRG